MPKPQNDRITTYLKALRSKFLYKNRKQIPWTQLSKRTGISNVHLERLFEGTTPVKKKNFITIVSKGFKQTNKNAESAWADLLWEEYLDISISQTKGIKKIRKKFDGGLTILDINVKNRRIHVSAHPLNKIEPHSMSMFIHLPLKPKRVRNIEELIIKIELQELKKKELLDPNTEINLQDFYDNYPISEDEFLLLLHDSFKTKKIALTFIGSTDCTYKVHDNGTLTRIPILEIPANLIENGISKKEAQALIKQHEVERGQKIQLIHDALYLIKSLINE